MMRFLTKSNFRFSKINLKAIFILFFLILIKASAYPNQNKTVKIAGTIDGFKLDSGLKTFNIKVINSHAQAGWKLETTTYSAEIVEGSFNIEIPIKEQIVYAVFYIGRAEDQPLIPFYKYAVGEAMFILESNDELFINILSSDDISFSGKGSEKLECQKHIYSQRYIRKDVQYYLSDLYNQGDLEKYYEVLDQELRYQLNEKLTILSSYRRYLADDIYQMIYYDCIGNQYIPALFSTRLRLRSKKSQPVVKFARYLTDFLQVEYYDFGKNNVMDQSAYYSKCFYEKERLKIELSPSQDYKDSFIKMISDINRDYNPPLRDQILTISLLESANVEPEIQKETHYILRDMVSERPIEIINNWYENRKVGAKAYPFELSSSEGKYYNLKDFEGKVLLVDFWFNGCLGCRNMTPKLQDIAKEFANQDVVFISVNVDKNKDRWIDGIQSGLYTFKDQIELSTLDDGVHHAFLKHYNINAYPHLLLIDKNGNNGDIVGQDPRIDDGKSLINQIWKMLE